MWLPTSKTISAPSWRPRSTAQASRKPSRSARASSRRSSSRREMTSSSRKRRSRIASGLRTKLALCQPLARQPPLLVPVRTEVPVSRAGTRDELGLHVGRPRIEAYAAFDDLVRQHDRDVVQGNEIDGGARHRDDVRLLLREIL